MGYFIHEDQPAGLPLANVDQLNDVNITSPANKDVLSYDSTSQKWVNDSSINSALASMFKGDYWATPFVKYGAEWYAIVNFRGNAPDTDYTVGDFSFLGGGTVPAMTTTKFTYGIRFVCNTDVTGRVMKLTVS